MAAAGDCVPWPGEISGFECEIGKSRLSPQTELAVRGDRFRANLDHIRYI